MLFTIIYVLSAVVAFVILYYVISSATKSSDRLSEAKKQTLLLANIAQKLEVPKETITSILHN